MWTPACLHGQRSQERGGQDWIERIDGGPPLQALQREGDIAAPFDPAEFSGLRVFNRERLRPNVFVAEDGLSRRF